MVLVIHYSNNLDILASILIKYLNINKINYYKNYVNIVVPNYYIANWLEIKITKSNDICFNLKFILSNVFYYWFFFKNINNNEQTDNNINYNQNYSHKLYIIWKLMCIFYPFNKKFISELIPLEYFYNKKNIIKLCINLSEIFIQYFFYRPELIYYWENNKFYYNKKDKDELWQARLWNLIFKKKENNYVIDNFFKIKNIEKIKLNKFFSLNRNIYIFAINEYSSLFIYLLNLLNKLKINIYLFINTPCKYLWENDQINDLDDLNMKNTLLSKWGYLINNNINNVLNLNHYLEIKALIPVKPNSLLNLIKLQIYNNTNNYNNHIIKQDDSIILNKCSNKLREIESLQEYLFNILYKYKKNININDIIIMINNLNSYTKYIKAIFNNNNELLSLPINIINHNKSDLNIGLQLLIELDNHVFCIKYIFKLLNINAIQKKFKLNNSHILLLKAWIKDMKIQDNCPHSSLINIKTNLFTLDWALKRMLLGYAMNNIDNVIVWHNIIPYDKSTGIFSEIIGNFSLFINKLKYWKIKFYKSYSLIMMKTIFNKFINDFFLLTSNEEQTYIYDIKQKWLEIIKQGLINKYIYKLYFKNLLVLLIKNIEFKNKQKILENHLNFCELNELNGLSFKVVCLVGMQSGKEYKNDHNISYNLIYKYPKKDNTIYLYYKQQNIFLQSLLYAKQNLYISYLDNPNNNPLKIVEELLIYIKNYIDDKLLNFIIFTKKNKNDISNFFDNSYKFISYNKLGYNLINNLKLTNINNTIKTLKPIINTVKNKNKKLYFDNFLKFWKNPLYYYFSYQNKIDFIDNKFYNTKKNILALYKIKQKILQNYVQNKYFCIKSFYLYCIQNSLISNGYFSLLLWNKYKKDLIILANKIKEQEKVNFNNPNIEKFIFRINNILILTKFNNIYNNKLICFKPKILNYADIFLFYLKHLIWCIKNKSKFYNKSIIYGLNHTYYEFYPLSENIAKLQLIKYIKKYYLGLYHPLLLTPQTINLYIKNLNSKTNNINLLKNTIYNKILFSLINDKNNCIELELYLKDNIKINNLIVNKFIINIIKWIVPIFHNEKINKYI